ncbi:MAG: hypothetical protein JWO62_804 [Acidimicrobiaceae bacterium]|nr:hypothetical protein [Acidimicrobiaceae bacterium]
MADYSCSIDIDAAPTVVFEHLVTADGLLAWMGQHAEVDPTPGGRFVLDVNGAAIRGAYLTVDPPNRVVVSWGMAGSEEFPPGSSRVEFTLTPNGSGTRLDLTHTELPDAQRPGYATGWSHFLAILAERASGPSSAARSSTASMRAAPDHGRGPT